MKRVYFRLSLVVQRLYVWLSLRAADVTGPVGDFSSYVIHKSFCVHLYPHGVDSMPVDSDVARTPSPSHRFH